MMKIKFLNEEFKNPILTASGTFGFGYGFSNYYDLNTLGGITLKGTTLEPRYGNPLPRIAECSAGLINAIGLENPGVEKVIGEEIPKLRKVYQGKIIANVGGHSISDYLETCKYFDKCAEVFAIELNVSCPNVKDGGMAFGVSKELLTKLIKEIKKEVTKPLIVKLSPNVTDIVKMAKACEEAGADALSLINTLVGMRLDLKTGKPIIKNIKGGYSGPGVFPVALRMVYEVSQAVKIPIIGMGGISSAYDVIEMLSAGASLVMVGSANLVDPYASYKIVNDLEAVMKELKIDNLEDIIGRAFK